MVYAGRWQVIVLPILLWLMTVGMSSVTVLLIQLNVHLASGVVMIWIECTTEENALLQDPRITPWLETLTACTLAVNVVVTCAFSRHVFL